MDLQPITAGNDNRRVYKEEDGIFREFEFPLTGGFSSTTIIGTHSDLDHVILITEGENKRTELFNQEKKYFKKLIQDNAFLEENKNKYIAIKDNKILHIGSTLSEVVKNSFKDKKNIGK